MFLIISKLQYLLFSLFLSSILAQPPRFTGGRDTGFFLPLRRPRPRECRINTRTLNGQCTSRFVSSYGEARLPQFSYQSTSSINPSGGNLKSAREISNIVFSQSTSVPNARGLNQLLVFFGQFLDHNFVATPEDDKERLDILVPENDLSLTERSLKFARSLRGSVSGGERPINILPSAVDLVAVYGPNELRNADLRETDATGAFTCRMKTSGDRYMPLNSKGFSNAPDDTGSFFLAGDHRANEHPALTAIHTIFLREHNRLAEEVESRRPDLQANDCYELARAMNVAQFQKIVFDEFYPAMVGERLRRFRRHRRKFDPTISDIFAGAAFRVGHTMVGQTMPTKTSEGVVGEVQFRDIFFRKADTFTSKGMYDVIRGTVSTRAEEVDGLVVDALRNGLFEFVPNVEGFDLVALNIQRGRDHALPKFQEIRKIFGLPPISDITDLTSDPVMQERLMQAYDNVDDIEAFPGLMAEDNAPGASMGATMVAAWKTEFKRLRNGDQFYYENRGGLPNDAFQFPNFIRRLQKRRKGLFRDIILQNSEIEEEDLPRNIFFV